jgi:hypothetical protein
MSASIQRQTPRTLVLNSHQDVSDLLADPSRWFWGRATLQLGTKLGDGAGRQALQRRLDFWLGVCGCQLAALLALSTFAWQMWTAHSQGDLGMQTVGQAMLISVAAALMAKLGALLLSRVLFALELMCLLATAGRSGPGAQP